MTLRAWAPVAALLFLVPPSAAHAQGTSVDAEELFKQGRVALEAGSYALACDKLAASLRIERAVGTLMSLAKCEEAQHQIASAREHWQEAADLAEATFDRLKRGPACREKFAELDPRVPRLTIHMATSPPGAVVKRDGVPLVAAALGVAMPVETGRHSVEVTAPGHEPMTFDVVLAEHVAKTLDVRPGPELPKPAVLADSGEQAPAPARPLGPLFWTGVGVTGAGLVVGIAAGAVALGKKSELSTDCPGGDCMSPAGRSAYDTAVSSSLASDVGFALAGAAAVFTGIAWLAHRQSASGPPAVSLDVGPRGVVVRGSFR